MQPPNPTMFTIKVSSLPDEKKRYPDGEVKIHFPIFPQRWTSNFTKAYGVFSRNFETNSLGEVPDYDTLTQSVTAYNSFCAITPGAPMFPGSADFWEEIRKRKNVTIVYFLDRYFSAKNLNRILLFAKDIPESNGEPEFRIKIITAAKHNKDEIYEDCKNKLIGDIRILIRDLPYKDAASKVALHILNEDEGLKIHDRFVVFEGTKEEDNIFWHFGASSAGMSGKLNAYTGPWEDKDGKFCSLIADLLGDAPDEIAKIRERK